MARTLTFQPSPYLKAKLEKLVEKGEFNSLSQLINTALAEWFKARISCQDVLKTDFPGGYFDVVTSTMTIEHCDDVAFIKEAGRILKQTGKLLITTVLRDKRAWYYLKNEKGEPGPGWMGGYTP